MQDYLRCVAAIDESTGTADGLDGRTVVVYSSDQGFFLGDHGWYDKRFMYEESLRMPLLLRWPGVVAPGTVEDALVSNVDLAPTFLDAAGIAPTDCMQGRSLLPLLRGERPAEWRDAVYYRYWMHLDSSHRVEAHAGVRTADRKYVYFYGDGRGQPGAEGQRLPPTEELFDLEADPYELRSAHDDPRYKADLQRLRAEMRRLAAEVGDDLP